MATRRVPCDGGLLLSSPLLERASEIVTAISCGANHNLALGRDGAVYSWGYGDMNALGQGNSNDVTVPRRISFEAAGFKPSAVTVSQVIALHCTA